MAERTGQNFQVMEGWLQLFGAEASHIDPQSSESGLSTAREEAEAIFTETKKFLYISRQPGVFIPDELLIVDEMWHNFILFTATYQEFCLRYFGIYIHHTPAAKAEKIKHREQLANTVPNASHHHTSAWLRYAMRYCISTLRC